MILVAALCAQVRAHRFEPLRLRSFALSAITVVEEALLEELEGMVISTPSKREAEEAFLEEFEGIAISALSQRKALKLGDQLLKLRSFAFSAMKMVEEGVLEELKDMVVTPAPEERVALKPVDHLLHQEEPYFRGLGLSTAWFHDTSTPHFADQSGECACDHPIPSSFFLSLTLALMVMIALPIALSILIILLDLKSEVTALRAIKDGLIRALVSTKNGLKYAGRFCYEEMTDPYPSGPSRPTSGSFGHGAVEDWVRENDIVNPRRHMGPNPLGPEALEKWIKKNGKSLPRKSLGDESVDTTLLDLSPSDVGASTRRGTSTWK
jgi:hypothetical protein